MVTLYTGTPGSGKSLHMTEVMLRVLRAGRMVISNYPIKFNQRELRKGWDKRFFYWTNDQITVKSLLEFAIDYDMIEKKKESQALVIIDEAGGRFNSRDYSNRDRSEWIDFFSQHRKVGYDFILGAQADRMIDRQIRGFIETEKKHRKINNFGPFAMLPFSAFVVVEHWYTAKQRVGSEFFRYKKKVGARYDSMKMFEGFKLPPELLKKIEEKQNQRQLQDEVFKKDGTEDDYNSSIESIYNEDKE